MKVSLEKNKSNWIQWVATLAVFMLNMQIGFFIGWTSPNIAWLLSDKSPIPMTPSDISWMISIATLGAPVGSILGSILVEYVGSRKTVLVTFLLAIVSWMCLLFANSVNWLYTSKIISALPCSMLFCCFSIYLSEVSDEKIRGTLISLAVTGASIGNVLAVTAETYLEMNVSSSIYLTEALIGSALILWLKDTPYILVKKADIDAAKRSIEFYRGSARIEKELDAIRLFVEKSEGFRDKLKKLRLPSVRKSMFVIFVVFGLPHLSGAMIILSYMEIILSSAKIDFVEPAQCVIYTNIIAIVAAFLTIKLSDKLGRRFLLIVSCTGTSIALIALGIHFYLLSLNFDAQTLQWLPIVSLLTFFITYPIGYGSVPGTLLSEMFPENMKSIAACVATLSASFFGFVVLKAYQPIVDAFGHSYAFWIHAILSALGIPCALFLLVETKGKTFQQIQDELNKK